MKYENIIEGHFIDRPNRFIANVMINGELQKVHVKNTGRCKELLEKGNTVYLEDFKNKMGTRKLRYSLISVLKKQHKNTEMGQNFIGAIDFNQNFDKILVNMDSQAPNKVVHEALLNGKIILPNMDTLSIIKAEQKYNASRFDFYVEDVNKKRAYIEVKGCTLEKNGVAYFPDAPTSRGAKHIYELAKAANEGFCAFIIFVIQIENLQLFKPNWETDPYFSEALLSASSNGVNVLAYNCNVSFNTLSINNSMQINLNKTK